MIVKNEAADLPHALASFETLGDLLTEVCIYDTGSSDSTIELARAWGARVEEGHWDDDFSRARNAAFAMVRTPWALVVDADERVVADAPALRRALSHALTVDEVDGLRIGVDDVRPHGVTAFWQGNRVVRVGRLNYRNRVHESLARTADGAIPRGAPLPREVLHLTHHGYGVAEQEADRRPRNLRLGDLEVADARRADDVDRLAQALLNRGRSRAAVDDGVGALEDWAEVLDLDSTSPFHLAAGEHLIEALLAEGQTPEAESILQRLSPLHGDSHALRWLTAGLRRACGDNDGAYTLLSGMPHPTTALGDDRTREALRLRCLTAATTGRHDEAFAAARELVCDHGEVDDFGRLLLLLADRVPACEVQACLSQLTPEEQDRLGAVGKGLPATARFGGQHEYSVKAVIIARDEARCIARCVASVRPFVDEVLVVDTGSVDDTVALAQEAGATTGFFAWIGNFAAARNAALDMACADWHVIIDADEVISAGGAALAALRDVAPDHVCVADVVSTFDLDGAEGIEHEEQMRVLPGHVRYAGAVHNQPDHDLPLKRLGVTIAHDGYETEQLEGKIQRREQMLREVVEARPDDDYMLFQLARNLEIQGRTDEAVPFYRRVDVHDTAQLAWHHLLVVQMAHTLTTTGHSLEAVELLAEFENTYAASSDYHFVLGNVLLDLATQHPAQAAGLLPQAVQAWQRAEAIGDDIPFLGHVHGRGSHLARHNIEVVEGMWAPASEARQG